MTIGIEATKAYEEEKTGVGWYTYYLINELAKLDKRDVYFTLYINPHAKVQSSKFKVQSYNSKLKIKILSWRLRYLWTQLRLSYEMLMNPTDVLFMPAHLPSLIHPKKLVVTIHDLAFKQYSEAYSAMERILQEWGIRRVLKRAWRIIVPSEFTKSEIYRWYPWHKKNNIYVVPHGVDGKFKIKSEKFKVKEQYILYIGRIENKKNIINLIKAFNALKKDYSLLVTRYSLLLIGPRGFGYREIQKEITTSPYKNDIRELGWLDREKTEEYLRSAALFVFPSTYEGFGLPVLEAFAAGMPVVASNIPALREVGGDAPLYCNPRDPKDIAEKMLIMLKNETTRRDRIERGIARARLFSWRIAAEKTFAILREGV